jgi:hypothetical protein
MMQVLSLCIWTCGGTAGQVVADSSSWHYPPSNYYYLAYYRVGLTVESQGPTTVVGWTRYAIGEHYVKQGTSSLWVTQAAIFIDPAARNNHHVQHIWLNSQCLQIFMTSPKLEHIPVDGWNC